MTRYFSRHSQKIADALSKRSKDHRRLAANAELLSEFITASDPITGSPWQRVSRVTIRLHRTDIVTVNTLTGEIDVKHGGWITPTTRTWIESALEVLTGGGKASNAGGTMQWWSEEQDLKINADWTPVATRPNWVDWFNNP